MFCITLMDSDAETVQALSHAVPWQQFHCRITATAHTAAQLSTILSNDPPDILIADIPDGLAPIARGRAVLPNLQIALLTDCRDFNTAREAIQLGVARYMLKPPDPDEIAEALTYMTGVLRQNAPLQHPLPSYCQQPPSEAVDSFVVRNALRYIRENYKEKVTLQNVADHVYVSQWYLSRLLKKHTGENFVSILQKIRVDKAKELLQNPSLRISDVANMVGFTDVTHFSKIFKKTTGSAAGKYRDQSLD